MSHTLETVNDTAHGADLSQDEEKVTAADR